MPADNLDAPRRAAMLVRDMSASEQVQLLARLAPADAQRLKKLLGDIDDPVARGAAHVAQAGLSPEERVARLSATEALHALSHCSVQLAARLLNAAAWPWREHVLRRTPQPRRTAIEELLRNGQHAALPPAAFRVLCEHILRLSSQRDAASGILSRQRWYQHLSVAFQKVAGWPWKR